MFDLDDPLSVFFEKQPYLTFSMFFIDPSGPKTNWSQVASGQPPNLVFAFTLGVSNWEFFVFEGSFFYFFKASGRQIRVNFGDGKAMLRAFSKGPLGLHLAAACVLNPPVVGSCYVKEPQWFSDLNLFCLICWVKTSHQKTAKTTLWAFIYTCFFNTELAKSRALAVLVGWAFRLIGWVLLMLTTGSTAQRETQALERTSGTLSATVFQHLHGAIYVSRSGNVPSLTLSFCLPWSGQCAVALCLPELVPVAVRWSSG